MNYQEICQKYKLDTLIRANLSRADLRGVNLRHSNLSDAILSRAILIRANLEGADLEGVNLSYTNLEGANLRGADLNNTNLEGAILRGAALEGIKINWCIGDGVHIKTLIALKWHISWTKTDLAIGCEQHTISDWMSFTDEDIKNMHPEALEFWGKYKDFIFKLVSS